MTAGHARPVPRIEHEQEIMAGFVTAGHDDI